MNKLLIAIVNDETAANAGLNALRGLHGAGAITLRAAGVLARDAGGVLSVRKPLDGTLSGTATGLAVGSLIGLLGGPVGLAIGAVAGVVRDFRSAGVGLDFVEEAGAHLQPGRVALVAEVEEEWVIPVDAAIEAVGGQVFRRSRTEAAEAQSDHAIAAIRSEIRELEQETSHAGGIARGKLSARLAETKARLGAAVHRAKAAGRDAEAGGRRQGRGARAAAGPSQGRRARPHRGTHEAGRERPPRARRQALARLEPDPRSLGRVTVSRTRRHVEQHRSDRIGWLRAAVLGASDTRTARRASSNAGCACQPCASAACTRFSAAQPRLTNTWWSSGSTAGQRRQVAAATAS